MICVDQSDGSKNPEIYRSLTTNRGSKVNSTHTILPNMYMLPTSVMYVHVHLQTGKWVFVQ